MELLSAHYDNRENRFVMGAQDNCAQVTKPNAKPTDVAIGFVEGRRTVHIGGQRSQTSKALWNNAIFRCWHH